MSSRLAYSSDSIFACFPFPTFGSNATCKHLLSLNRTIATSYATVRRSLLLPPYAHLRRDRVTINRSYPRRLWITLGILAENSKQAPEAAKLSAPASFGCNRLPQRCIPTSHPFQLHSAKSYVHRETKALHSPPRVLSA